MKRAFLVLAMAATTACESGPFEPRFGFYTVELSPNAPALGATTLSVSVSYGSCSANQPFALRHRVIGETADLWLERTQKTGMECDMLVTERRTFEISARIQASKTITLLGPGIDPIPLRQ
jgi:hypothetical protein